MSTNEKSVPPNDIPVKKIEKPDVEFLGWQETLTGERFPLYNVMRIGHPSYRSTVTEETLKTIHLRTPRTPSPFPDVAASPWHSTGTSLVSPATSREAIEAAGLNYTVVKKPLADIVALDHSVNLSDRWATVRTDTGDILGVVGSAYEPIQNTEAFGFFDHLVGSGEAIYETAGAIGRGERIWILAKLPGYIKVHGKDLVSKYLLLSNSHDGSSLVQMKLTPIRVVCNNTLTAALKGAGEINIRHTLNAAGDVDQAFSLLGLSNTLYDQLEVVFNRMALKKITDAQVREYVKALVPDNEDKDNAHNLAIRNACMELYESGHGADLSRGTLWGAFNCITEYTDHSMENDPANRMESIWSGRGERMTHQAFRLAEKMM